MAVRPIYQSQSHAPFCEIIDVNFQFYSGFSTSQKQKSIESLHKQYNKLYPEHNVLEISSKSKSDLGVALSAFHLKIKTPQCNCSVECAFQSSKVFEEGGPFTDLLDKSSREAKKDQRLHESGKLTAFQYFDYEFPLEPKDYFYNWLYINALMQNQELAHAILEFDSFSDIEFNPQKSINCQAKAAAVFVGLSKQHLLEDALLSHENFLKIVYER
ncbi:MAG: hypothetical protein K2M91_01580 [Lachnospiraceae bacterium]|nr:hypothetical protein [Lachnospiraceae bacterium]